MLVVILTTLLLIQATIGDDSLPPTYNATKVESLSHLKRAFDSFTGPYPESKEFFDYLLAAVSEFGDAFSHCNGIPKSDPVEPWEQAAKEVCINSFLRYFFNRVLEIQKKAVRMFDNPEQISQYNFDAWNNPEIGSSTNVPYSEDLIVEVHEIV